MKRKYRKGKFGKIVLTSVLSLSMLLSSFSAAAAQETSEWEEQSESTVESSTTDEAESQESSISEEPESSEEEIQIQGDEEAAVSLEEAEATAVDLYGDEKNLDIQLKNYTPENNESLSVAVWSEENGQDDLQWYSMSLESDGCYHSSVDVSKHKSAGRYFAHIYGSYYGKMNFIADTDFKITASSCDGVSVESLNNATGSCRIVISGATSPSGISKVIVPVWSKSDQSDLVWYTAKKDSNGNYYVDLKISDFDYSYTSYTIHVYAVNGNNVENFIGQTKASFTFQEGSVTSQKNSLGKTYQLCAEGFSVSGEVSSCSFAVWSEEDGQDDLTWTEASYDAESGKMEGTFSVDNLKHSGEVYVHAYVTIKNSGTHFVGSTSMQVSNNYCESVSIEDVDTNAGTCRVVVKGVSGSNIKEVSIPVWSQSNQGDIYWYKAEKQSDGSYTAYIDVANHLYNSGTYNVHVYLVDKDGNDEWVYADTVEFPDEEPEVSVTKKNGTYTITVDQLAFVGAITDPRIAVWSEEGGHDDFTSYSANYDSTKKVISVSFDESVIQHEGTVYVQVYNWVSHNLCLMLETSFQTDDIVEYLTVSSNNAEGSFEITLDASTLGSNVSEIEIPVWSQSDQSDIVWYKAKSIGNGKYKVNSSIAKHNYNLGTYQVHAYVKYKSGKMEFLASEEMEFEMSDAKLSFSSEDGSIYEFNIDELEVPAGAKKVSIAVWSSKNGQDDLKWYDASSNGGGSYTAEIDIRNHKDEGTYIVDAYVTLKSGKMVTLGRNTDINITDSAKASVSVSNVNRENGSFDVNISVSASSTDIESISVPVWCSSDQSDIKWYKASYQGNNTYKATVSYHNHKDHTGTYQIHVYANFEDGVSKMIGNTSCNLKLAGLLDVSEADGSYTRRITYTNGDEGDIRFAVWTKEDGQDDLNWYFAKDGGNGSYYADIDADDFDHNGTYYVHVYSGSTYLCSTSFMMIDYVEWAIATAADDSVGYSQVRRYMNPDVDCSSFVYYALKNSGFSSTLPSSAFYTGTQVAYMKQCGFTVLSYTSEDDLQPGDVLWYRRSSGGHTEIYVGDGKTVGAHDNVINGVDYSQAGDQTGQEVSVRSFFDPGWIYVLRIYD